MWRLRRRAAPGNSLGVALEINDTVVQGLVVAKMSLELGDTERAGAAIDSSLAAAKGIITGLLGEGEAGLSPGAILRRGAADLRTT